MYNVESPESFLIDSLYVGSSERPDWDNINLSKQQHKEHPEAMSYRGEISRANPTCFLFLVDQSGSMDERMESGRSKAEFVADVLNRTIYTLGQVCTKADGVRDYFDIGVLGYGGNSVAPGFSGNLAGQDLHSISMIADNPLRIEERKRKVDDGAGGVVEMNTKFPVWFEPKNTGGTPMRAAFVRAAEVLAAWCDAHPNSYPPTVLHITDGVSTDGSPEEIVEKLRLMGTDDGEILVFNLHVALGAIAPIVLPSDETGLPDDSARMLFRASSALPAHLVQAAMSKDYQIADGARGFMYNVQSPGFIVDFFDIGTRANVVAGDR